MDIFLHNFSLTFQVFFIDLLLSGDNAIVIALACKFLPKEQMQKAILIGIIFAIITRVVLTTVSNLLLFLPIVRLLGGVLLIIIAIKLMIEESEEPSANEINSITSTSFVSAVQTIVVADLVMSLDNVIALAAVIDGSVVYLIMGLLGSIPFLMYGSLIISRLLNEFPMLIKAGGALLGWIAGHIAITDTIFAQWVNTQSPALVIIVPLLCAIFVLLQSKIIKEKISSR